MQPAVVSASAERLTPDIIIRALGSLSLSGIDRVLREGREITFVSPPEARVSLLADVGAVMAPGEDDVWSEVICARLADLRPELYGSLDPTALASQLGAYGVGTRQVWGKTADGKKANRRGVSRADVLAVISSRQAARSSGSASDGSAL